MSPSRTPYREPCGFEEIEDVQRYVVGGFHPVGIGDWLCDWHKSGGARYRVIRKLGNGGFATVWWTQSSVDQRYYAVKVLCADADDHELETLQQLSSRGLNHPAIVTPVDSFSVIGPNGSHRCLVYPLLGPSLRQAWQDVPESSRDRVCRQIATGVEFLHENGICHGDLNPANILFEFRGVQDLSEAQISDVFGPVRTTDLRLHNGSSSPHGPDQVVQALEFLPHHKTMLGDVRIIDFGQCFNIDNPPEGLGIPIPYYPPELCFGYAPSMATDVWALACVIFEIQTRRPLVPMIFKNFDFLIGTLRFTLGTLPSAWKSKYSDDCAGEVIQAKGIPEIWFDPAVPLSWPLTPLIHERASHLSLAKKELLLDLLFAMFTFEPTERITVKEVLNHAWFREDKPTSG